MNLLNRYEKITNPWAKLALTPIMGGLFLMFMPAIGFILVGHALIKKVVEASTGIRTRIASLPS